MVNLVIIKTFNTRMEAEIAKGFLEANGVKAVVQADDEGGMAPFPFRPTSQGARLLVKESDLKKAEELF
ncbi:DUF2007 domain-containing protein [Candidatus Daviesbacteria bacterium]|nr:DUF2007 domain-containing protein [Candidatus Daviesbacteria bacterium]